MKEKVLKNKTLVIVVAAIVLAGIGFAAGMAVKTSLAENSGDYIGAERAKSIALENVGVSSSKATFTKVEVDPSEHPAVYDIEFYTASNEYDFEINAFTGEILEKSSEAFQTLPSAEESSQPETSAQTSPQPSDSAVQTKNNSGSSNSDYIGIDKAKSIALKHAGLSNVTFTKTKLDSDDGVKTYEIEFISDNWEYEYEINAYTGAIMDYDSERIDH